MSWRAAKARAESQAFDWKTTPPNDPFPHVAVIVHWKWQHAANCWAQVGRLDEACRSYRKWAVIAGLTSAMCVAVLLRGY